MRRAVRTTSLSLAAVILAAACESDEIFTEPVPDREDLLLHTLNSRITDGISEEIVLNAPDGLQSVLFEVRGDKGLYSISRFHTPNGELIEGAAYMTRHARAVPGLVDWLYPNTPNLELSGGKYRLTLLGETPSGGRLTEDVEIRVYAKKEQEFDTCGIKLDFLIDRNAIDQADIGIALETATGWVNNLFAPRGVRILEYTDTDITLPNPNFDVDETATVMSQIDDLLAQARRQGRAREGNLHVVLVRTIGGPEPSGYSMGLPGPFDADRPNAAVLVSTDAYTRNGFLDVPGLASTIAHELGHFLGLYHTSESSGTQHDPLPDTPQADDDGDEFDRNIMTGGGGARRNIFTEDQAFVFKRHPLCVPTKFEPPPPVTCDLTCTPPTTCGIVDGNKACRQACDPDAAEPTCTTGMCRPDDLGTYICR